MFAVFTQTVPEGTLGHAQMHSFYCVEPILISTFGLISAVWSPPVIFFGCADACLVPVTLGLNAFAPLARQPIELQRSRPPCRYGPNSTLAQGSK